MTEKEPAIVPFPLSREDRQEIKRHQTIRMLIEQFSVFLEAFEERKKDNALNPVSSVEAHGDFLIQIAEIRKSLKTLSLLQNKGKQRRLLTLREIMSIESEQAYLNEIKKIASSYMIRTKPPTLQSGTILPFEPKKP